MDEKVKKIVWFPTDKEKRKIEGICDKCIDLMEDLPVEQKAFTLQTLIESFQDVSGINVAMMVVTKFKERDLNERSKK